MNLCEEQHPEKTILQTVYKLNKLMFFNFYSCVVNFVRNYAYIT